MGMRRVASVGAAYEVPRALDAWTSRSEVALPTNSQRNQTWSEPLVVQYWQLNAHDRARFARNVAYVARGLRVDNWRHSVDLASHPICPVCGDEHSPRQECQAVSSYGTSCSSMVVQRSIPTMADVNDERGCCAEHVRCCMSVLLPDELCKTGCPCCWQDDVCCGMDAQARDTGRICAGFCYTGAIPVSVLVAVLCLH